jgi:hypothetical protein
LELRWRFRVLLEQALARRRAGIRLRAVKALVGLLEEGGRALARWRSSSSSSSSISSGGVAKAAAAAASSAAVVVAGAAAAAERESRSVGRGVQAVLFFLKGGEAMVFVVVVVLEMCLYFKVLATTDVYLYVVCLHFRAFVYVFRLVYAVSGGCLHFRVDAYTYHWASLKSRYFIYTPWGRRIASQGLAHLVVGKIKVLV